MKEIHAYQNPDGTYRVEIFNTVETTEVRHHETIKTTTESKTTIYRATIYITPMASLDGNEEEKFVITY